MDFQALLGGFLPPVAGNGTAAPGNSSPGSPSLHIIETVLPLVGLRGFAPIYRVVENMLGWDPSYLLAVLGFVWAINKLSQQISDVFGRLLRRYVMSNVHVDSADQIYTHLMAWLSHQPKLVNSRSIMASTVWKTAWEEEDISTMGRDSSGLYLNFSSQEARTRPKYIPSVGQHSFWWNGQYFRLERRREAVVDNDPGFGPVFSDKEGLIISCIWRNPGPIKQLLAHAKQEFFREHQARTTVKRPVAGRMHQMRHMWQEVASRPVRDMRTVILDQKQKLAVLADMNEYLHPATPRWYANRGIPLRRGYLFHGPPGTGKTSLSFALAGVFGLDIYVISLLEPSLTEEGLGSLFISLPRRCIVLLEDIDTAGLKRSDDGEESSEKKNEPASTDITAGRKKTSDAAGEKGAAEKVATSADIQQLAQVLRKQKKSEDEKKGISLSGLLNAIDGVASHEGRVLIMTTNDPESLDTALIRPGRVDLQVQFTNATKEQARELFIRMYEVDGGGPQRNESSGPVSSHPSSPSPSGASTPATSNHGKPATTTTKASQNPSNPADALDIAIDELADYAQRFGDKIPAGLFSPAEIQGYLLKRKKTPRRAVEEADEWVAALRQQKASKSKVVQVQ